MNHIGGGEAIVARSTKSLSTGDQPIVEFFGIPIFSNKNKPDRALHPDNSPGNCWAFEEEKGHLVIRLARPIYVTHTTIVRFYIIHVITISLMNITVKSYQEHIPKTASPSGSIQSAPREVTVVALSSEDDMIGYQIGTLSYDISGASTQVFPILKKMHFASQYTLIK